MILLFLWPDMYQGYVMSFFRRRQQSQSVNFHNNFQKNVFQHSFGSLKLNFLSSLSLQKNTKNESSRPSSVLLGRSYPPYLRMTMDISNFYLMTPLHHPEYIMQVNLINISDEVIEEYKLKEKATKSGSSTLWSNVTCMAYHNQDYWPTNCSRGNQMHTDVTQINQQSKLVPDLWRHYSRPSNSHWLSTILESNMLSQNIVSSHK